MAFAISLMSSSEGFGGGMRDQNVTAKRCIELEQSFLLNQPSRECPDHAVCIHSASLRIMLFLTGDSTNDDSVTSMRRNSNN